MFAYIITQRNGSTPLGTLAGKSKVKSYQWVINWLKNANHPNSFNLDKMNVNEYHQLVINDTYVVTITRVS